LLLRKKGLKGVLLIVFFTSWPEKAGVFEEIERMFNKKHSKENKSCHPPKKNKRFNRIEACLITFLALMFLAAAAFGQSGSASLTGSIHDASGGAVPGAAVLVRNVDTGVETRTASSGTGSYTFPSLPIGTYELTAEAPGFSRTVRTGIRLNVGASVRLDVTLAVAGTVTEISVSGETQSVILESGTSTGTVMQEEILASIPLVGTNVMELINVMGGTTPVTDSLVWGGLNQEFAGVNSRQINIMRDGMSINEVRYASGITAASNVNQEMIGEFKMVLSPVDAEMGRGAGQVQMTTRSGSNEFHGSGTWSIQNTALDAQDFTYKMNNTPKSWRNVNNYMLTASGPIIQNRTFFFVTWEQQFARTKSPITSRVMSECARKGIYRYIEGRTPGSATENNTYNPNSTTRPSVDMDGNILYGGTFDASGTPVTLQPGELMFESVFGPLNPTVRATLANPNNPHGAHGDCADMPFNGMSGQFGVTGPWDTREWGSSNPRLGRAYRYQYDPTGFVDRFTNGIEGLVQMPPINNYLIGDGLNLAGHRWTRSISGEGGYQEGIGGDPDRKAITFKIDHNINNDHRISGTYSYEHHRIDDSWPDWPQEYGGYGGSMSRKPQSFMINLTSTLRPTLLNEFRFGLTRPQAYTGSPIEGPNGDAIREIVRQLLPTGSGSQYFGGTKAQDLDILFSPGEGMSAFYNDNYNNIGAANTSHFYGGGYIRDSWGGWDPRWTIADTMTWLKGSHAFKAGVEYRRQSSNQDSTGTHSGPGFGGGALSAYPLVFGGNINAVSERRRGVFGQYAPPQEERCLKDGTYRPWDCLPSDAQDTGTSNPAGNVYTTPYAMMTYFSGAVSNTRQWFFQIPDANSPNGSRWNELADGETLNRITGKNQEIHFFFKDDWKVTNDLTLNLGIRYEYYGIPHIVGGRTLGLVGGGRKGAYGISEPGFDNWMKNRTYIKTAPGEVPDPVTRYQYIGPGSPNPDILPWNRDTNNFAPHLGFSYQLPWFGKGQTVLRGGWSVSYGQINTFDQFVFTLAMSGAAVPQTTVNYGGHGSLYLEQDTSYYMDLTDLPKMLPLSGNLVQELYDIVPMRPFAVGRFGDGVSTHDDYVTHPYTHNFNMSLTRNIGRSLTLDVRYIGTMGRDQIASPSSFNLNQSNFIDNGLQKEFAIVRAGGQSAVINSLIPTGALVSSALAPGATGSEQLRHTSSATYSNLAAGNFNGVVSGALAFGNGTIPAAFAGQNGNLLRAGCLPEDRQGYLAAFAADERTPVQLNDTTYPCQYGTPWNYFSTNPQHRSTAFTHNATLTNYHSMQVQATLRPTQGLNFQATYTWSRNINTSGWTNYVGERDYDLSGQHRTHSLNTYGSYVLPFGANGFFLRDASGVFKKAIEGWQVSWITSMSSGMPINVSGLPTMWNNSYSVLVRPDLWDEKSGSTSEMWDKGIFMGGRYFGDKYTKVLDRGICNAAAMETALYNQYCVNLITSAPRALALASGERDATGNLLPLLYDSDYTAADGVTYRAGDPIIVFRNANQLDYNGSQYIGNYKSGRATAPGYFSFDMAMSKSIEFMEGKRFEIRVDAKNILNHATPTAYTTSAAGAGGRTMSISSPSLAVNSTAVFGNLAGKAGHRTFQARLSLRF